jgi:flagellar biosynthetic protein FliR
MVNQETLLLVILVFCRIGGCFMVLPGISSERIPMQARIFFALAISMAIAPVVMGQLQSVLKPNAETMLYYILTETMVGLLLGFFVRIFFLALEFGAIAAANFVGYGSVFAQSIESSESTTPLAMIVTLPATALFFILDLHILILDLLQRSYTMFPPVQPFDFEPTMRALTTTLGTAFKLAMQVSAPLIVFSLSINLLLGFLNKMVPQIPVYYVSTPFLLLGGLLVFYFLVGAMLLNFHSTLSAYILEFMGRG